MPKGLAVPVRVGRNGGTVISDSDEQDNKIIKLALGDDDNENAFQQDIGLGVGMIFDVSDPTMQARVEGRLRSIFLRFEAQKRFRLRPETIEWGRDGNGETELRFMYLNLESDEPREFKQVFSNES